MYKGPTPSTRSPDSLVDFHTGGPAPSAQNGLAIVSSSMVRTTHMTGCATTRDWILGRAKGRLLRKRRLWLYPAREESVGSLRTPPWASLAVRLPARWSEADIPNARAPSCRRDPVAAGGTPPPASSTRAFIKTPPRPVSIAPGSSSATTPHVWSQVHTRTRRGAADEDLWREGRVGEGRVRGRKLRATSATCSGAVFGTGIFFHVSGAAAISFLFVRPWPGHSHSSPAWHSTFRD